MEPQFEGALRAGRKVLSLNIMIPMFVGTLLISLVAVSVAVPVGPLSAIYLAEYATKRVRSIVKPLLEIWLGFQPSYMGFLQRLRLLQW